MKPKPFVNRSDERITADVRQLLLKSPEYCVVREFFSTLSNVEASVRWTGIPDATYVVSVAVLREEPPKYFATEKEAVAFYEDTLSLNGCGEWVTTEDGTTYFLAHFNDSPYAVHDNPDIASTESRAEFECTTVIETSGNYGTW